MLGTKRVIIRSIVPILYSGIFLMACSQAEIDPLPQEMPSDITPQSTVVAQQTITQTTNQPTQGPDQCLENGWVKRYQIDSELMDGAFFFSVYYPPCYSEENADKYPVLYALHGQNFDDGMWVDLGMTDVMDQLILDGDAQPFLVVMPYEEFYFRGAEVNNFPIALKEEIIQWVEGTLNVCAEKTCRAIGGISRGASWAIRIGLTDPDFFGSIGAHSLPTFRGDIGNLPEWLEAISFGEEPRLYLDTGRFDPEVKNAYRFEQILNEKGIPHDWHMNEGRHNEEYWKEHMLEYIRWYAAAWPLRK